MIEPLRSTMIPTTWRVLETAPLDGATNMAIDVGLMQRARQTGESVFRVYQWNCPTLSLGRNQRAAGVYDRDAIAERQLRVVRRPTGGRAILHWREVTYSVTMAVSAATSLAAIYTRLNAVLLRALRMLDIPAEVARRRKRERSPDAHPCFAEPSSGEIVLQPAGDSAPRKLVGSAQYSERDALLQHGSLLLDDDQAELRHLSFRPTPTAAAAVNEIRGATIPREEVTAKLFNAFRELVGPNATPLRQAEALEFARPHVAQFNDPLWTWRR